MLHQDTLLGLLDEEGKTSFYFHHARELAEAVGSLLFQASAAIKLDVPIEFQASSVEVNSVACTQNVGIDFEKHGQVPDLPSPECESCKRIATASVPPPCARRCVSSAWCRRTW